MERRKDERVGGESERIGGTQRREIREDWVGVVNGPTLRGEEEREREREREREKERERENRIAYAKEIHV